MFSAPEFRLHRQLSTVAAIMWVILALSWHGMATGDFREDFMDERAVKVVVRGVNPNAAASGFLWKQNNWVVTNLHAIPSDRNIKVICGGLIESARVAKVLPSADLALLVVDPPVDEGLALRKCKPYTEADINPPDSKDDLTARGWLGESDDPLSRFMKRSGTGPLAKRIGSRVNVLEALHNFGIPDTRNVDFYILQGGTFPGFSGAAIVNDDLKLVAIVDGGLNDGMGTINWAIPVDNLTKLVDNGVDWQPRFGTKPEWLWSTAIANPDRYSVLEYREEDWYDDTYYDYNWVRTKRLSARQLAQSSLDPEGILALLTIYGDAAGGDVDPKFDVYEDLNQGLIIAVPADQGLSMQSQFDEMPEFKILRSAAVPVDDGEIIFRQTNRQVTSSSTGKQISPNDPRFFNEKISELLSECSDFGDWSCEIDPPTLRVIHFENGDQILKAGIKMNSVNEPLLDIYTYYSFAVSKGITFYAEASFDTPPGESGLIQCAMDPGSAACADTNKATRQLSQMLAVHLTTFATYDPKSGRSLETRIDFDSSADHPNTIRTAYLEGDEVRFFNSRGKIWLEVVNLPGGFSETNEYLEYDRNSSHVYILRNGMDKMRVEIPINGGRIRRSIDGGQTWNPVGELKRIRKKYFEGDAVRFINSRGKIWLEKETFPDGGLMETEYREYDRKSGHVYIWSGGEDKLLRVEIPINGGNFQRSIDGGQTWNPVGELKRK